VGRTHRKERIQIRNTYTTGMQPGTLFVSSILHLYCSPNIVRVIKLGRMRWAV